MLITLHNVGQNPKRPHIGDGKEQGADQGDILWNVCTQTT